MLPTLLKSVVATLDSMSRPLVIAHRGASARFPENTIAALVGALDLGADWVELDVRRTGCGNGVVHHDAVLEDGTVIVDVTVDDLPDHIPTLEAAIEACGPMGLNIEIKSVVTQSDYDDSYPVVSLVSDIVRGRLTSDRVLISSFDMGAINAVHDVKSSAPTGFLSSDDVGPEVLVGRAVAHGHSAINPADAIVTQRFVDVAHEAGLRVFPWVVEARARMSELIDFGVDGIITKFPDVLRELL